MNNYGISKDNIGQIWQWSGNDLAMVVDRVTGEPLSVEGSKIFTLGHALSIAMDRRGWEDRMVVVKLNCLTATKIGVSK